MVEMSSKLVRMQVFVFTRETAQTIMRQNWCDELKRHMDQIEIWATAREKEINGDKVRQTEGLVFHTLETVKHPDKSKPDEHVSTLDFPGSKCFLVQGFSCTTHTHTRTHGYSRDLLKSYNICQFNRREVCVSVCSWVCVCACMCVCVCVCVYFRRQCVVWTYTEIAAE